MAKRPRLEQSGSSSSSLFSLEDLSELDEENKLQALFDIIDSVCTFQQQSRLQQDLQRRLCRDFLSLLPPEIAFQILGYLDVEDLLRGLQVCRKWRQLITEATPVWKAVAKKGLHCRLPLRIYDMLNKPHLFHPQTRITWKTCADLPMGTELARTVVIGDKVYVGGGTSTSHTIAQDYQVFSYSLSEDVWNSLPDCPVRWFGMGQLEGRVVAIGGWRSDDETTNEVYVLDENSQSWKDSIIPPMTTPRHSPAVLSHHSSLIVAGGKTPSGLTSVVELFRQDTSQWHRTCPLPFLCRDMSPVVIQNTAYLLGGCGIGLSNRVMYASVDSLLQKSLPLDQTSEDSDSVWKSLPNTPHYGSAAATISGCLLAVGGGTPESVGEAPFPQKEVYIYSPSTASWLHVSDLPSPRCTTTTAVISPTEFLVIGGLDHSYQAYSVFKASLES